MRPTLEQGLWAEVNEIKNTTIQAGWITHISPRSTVRWYKVDQSIGIYPVGLNESGVRSGYANAIESNGIGLLGVDYKKASVKEAFILRSVINNHWAYSHLYFYPYHQTVA